MELLVRGLDRPVRIAVQPVMGLVVWAASLALAEEALSVLAQQVGHLNSGLVAVELGAGSGLPSWAMAAAGW